MLIQPECFLLLVCLLSQMLTKLGGRRDWDGVNKKVCCPLSIVAQQIDSCSGDSHVEAVLWFVLKEL